MQTRRRFLASLGAAPVVLALPQLLHAELYPEKEEWTDSTPDWWPPSILNRSIIARQACRVYINGEPLPIFLCAGDTLNITSLPSRVSIKKGHDDADEV